MRAFFPLLVVALLGGLASGDDLKFLDKRQTLPTTFTAPTKENTPSKPAQSKAKSEALDWLARRLPRKGLKIDRWEFVGEFLGRPTDDRPRKRYAVYRALFKPAVELGGASFRDVLFYVDDTGWLACPPEEHSVNKPPPGQMMAVVRDQLPDRGKSR